MMALTLLVYAAALAPNYYVYFAVMLLQSLSYTLQWV